MALTWQAVTKNAANDARAALFNSGYLRIYTAAFATLLAELRFNATAFGASVAGVATSNAFTSDPDAPATGTAAVFRAYKSDGTTLLLDGTVTATGGGGDCTMPTVSIVQHDIVENLSAITMTQP